MRYVKLGAVRAFPGAVPDKAQALKVLEEAAEVFGAWQEWDRFHRVHSVFDHPKAMTAKAMKESIIAECCDTIQACCNLAASLGVTDLTPYLARCEERNRERGRYDSGDR